MRWRVLVSVLLLAGLVVLGSLVNADDFTVQINNDGLNGAEFKECEKAVREAMTWVPERHLQGLDLVVLHNHTDWRRGLAGNDIIYLQCLNDLLEMKSVFIHELGHVVDLNLIRKNPHLNYYSEISWIDTIVALNNEQGFVSEYAQTNAYEDFAETYAYFVLHGEKFRHQAASNFLIKRKYTFMNYAVFAGLEFNLENKQIVLTSENESANMGNTYDVTKLSYQHKR